MTPCPVVPGNIISKGIRLRRKQTLEPSVAHLPNYLLDSGSLSWAKDLFSKITHCQTILWYSKMAEILINPRWIGRKTTLNQLFSCSLKFNKQYFLKLMEVSKWQFQHEINSRGIYDWSTPKVLITRLSPEGVLPPPVGFCNRIAQRSGHLQGQGLSHCVWLSFN